MFMHIFTKIGQLVCMILMHETESGKDIHTHMTCQRGLERKMYAIEMDLKYEKIL